MTDLEMTKRCAEAMGFQAEMRPTPFTEHDILVVVCPGGDWYAYNPLDNNAQAMALVKKFRLDIYGADSDKWGVQFMFGQNKQTSNADLNRAIVECVALLPSRPVPA